MEHKELMRVIADVYNRLYHTPFSGDQMLVVSDCLKILYGTLEKMNEPTPTPKEETSELSKSV